MNKNYSYLRESIDPVNQVFFETRILRGIKKEKINIFQPIINKLYDLQLSELIPFSITKESTDEYPLILEHPFIYFESLISEWPPEAIRDAGVMMMSLHGKLNSHGLTLKDGHSLNIQFIGPRPYFIDIGSITYSGSNGWFDEWKLTFLPVLQQYCNYHLDPNQWTITTSPNLLSSLKMDKISDSGWNTYPQPKALTRPKDTIVEKIITNEIKGYTVLDIGCNRGLYSKLLAKGNRHVVATDLETNCCNDLYQEVKHENLDILVLNYDLRNEYGNGVFGEYYKQHIGKIRPAHKRLACDTCFASAVTHHLAHAGWSIPEIVRKLTSYTNHILIVEFIPKEDTYISNWGLPPSYSLNEFYKEIEKYWETVQIINSDPSPRVFLIAKTKKYE